MGADARRKEARKRKFEGGLRIGSCKRNLQLLPSESEVTTPTKKAEVTSQGLLALEPEDLSLVIERPVTSKSGGLGLQERNEVPAVKPHRFICFIGNLPYTATQASIARHFEKIRPCAIRHRTFKDTDKSRGFAFLEFDDYHGLKSCLDTFHHSSFDDGLSSARPINVELTAGGGGAKSKERKLKLQVKNEKLNGQRQRQALLNSKVDVNNEKALKVFESRTLIDRAAIHPSRRGIVAIERRAF